jgi:hypothetical protein
MRKVILISAFIFFFTSPLLAQDVDTAWVRRYDGPASSGDYAHAIAVDTSGNIYVTGESYASGTRDDYTTVKYYPNGDTAWVRRYNGPGNSADKANAIVVDNYGNVWVTGKSYGGSQTDYDCATVKYDSDGNQEWVKRYNGPDSLEDEAFAIEVDDSGNVYVAGRSAEGILFGIPWYDYITIKYDSEGNEISVVRYDGLGGDPNSDGARALALDASGNVIVTGYSFDNYFSYTTIKYDSVLDVQWTRRYPDNIPEPHWYDAFDVAVDKQGNIYVTGSIRDDWDSLTEQWQNAYGTIKYTPDGIREWVSKYNSVPAESSHIAYSVAVDGDHVSYVTGKSYGLLSSYDYATVKYNSWGDTLWVRRYNTLGTSVDSALDLAVDNSGYVHVTGYSGGDYATIRYNPDGDTIWVERYNGPGDSEDGANAITCYCGNVYVTGASRGSGTYYDYATIKYVQDIGRGDVNGNGSISISDIISLLYYMFKNGDPPDPLDKGDCNCDCKISVADAIYLINYLFKYGPAPQKYCK